jgi:hypothetical protein
VEGQNRGKRGMRLNLVEQIKKGARISYNDGRPGHQGVEATVLEVDREGMTVLFDDRADTSYIRFSDRAWMDFISVVG